MAVFCRPLVVGTLIGAASIIGLVGSASAGLVSSPACAGSNLISDGCFSNSNDSSPGFATINAGTSFGSASNSSGPWTVTTGSIDLIGNYWQAPFNYGGSVDIDGNSPGGISQTVTTVPGQQYLLTFWLSGNPDGPPETKSLFVTATADPPYSYTIGLNSHGSMNYIEEFLNFTATTDSTLISFFSDDSDSPYGPVIGDVSLAATPLPQTLSLIAGGIGLVGFIARRKRKNRAARLELAS
jgi:choice-of-anchor C domain-containing protein